jgi:hypothetical protein
MLPLLSRIPWIGPATGMAGIVLRNAVKRMEESFIMIALLRSKVRTKITALLRKNEGIKKREVDDNMKRRRYRRACYMYIFNLVFTTYIHNRPAA